MLIVYFKSYSGDEFFLKTNDEAYLKNAEKFCEHYIPEEFAGWLNNFKYEKFSVCQVNDGETARINRSFGEYYLVYPEDIAEFDKAYSTDSYCPDTFSRQGENLGGLVTHY